MASLHFAPVPKLIGLLQSVGGHHDMFVRILDENRLAVGSDPFEPSAVIDLSGECVLPITGGEPQPMAPSRQPASQSIAHGDTWNRFGLWFELLGRRADCSSRKSLLIEALRAIEGERPGTLEKLSKIKPRNRRIVARDPRELYDNPNLRRDIDNFAERLSDEWWVGTNNSTASVKAWLHRACAIAGLDWGNDFKASL